MKKKLILTQILFTALATSLFANYENYDRQDVSGMNFSDSSLIESSWIDCTAIGTAFVSTKLTGAKFIHATLTNANFIRATLTSANFNSATLTKANFDYATLTKADFTNAIIIGASFNNAIGFTKEQLYSTASYEGKNLTGIHLVRNNLTGCNFAGQNLTKADFRFASLTSANFASATLTSADFASVALISVNFTNAIINGANFRDATDFTKEQLCSTASYKNKDLTGIDLGRINLTGCNFESQNLVNTSFYSCTLTNANFTNAIISGAAFTKSSFTKEQLYSTASYKNKDLTGIHLVLNDLTGWDFAGQNLTNAVLQSATLTSANFASATLTNASFYSATLTNANFTDAIVTGANFYSATLTNANFTDAIVTGANFNETVAKGFTSAQLYSTASYKNKDLSGIALEENDLSGWNFTGQNLTGARFAYSTLRNEDFTNANLTRANFDGATLTNADFTDAIVTGANFGSTVAKGFTSAQLYSTASYKNKDLSGIRLYDNVLRGWNFAGQNLTNASFISATLTDVDFSKADLRGAEMYRSSGAPIYKNTIMSDGKIKSFSMTSSDDNFSIRKYVPESEPEYSYTGPMISAKFAEDASVSGGAMLTLEQGAEVEVVENATLSFGADSSLLINTDKDGSTTFSVESGAGLIFANGATLTVNIIDADSALNADGYKFAVMNWNDGSSMTGLDDFVIDSTLFLTLNGTSYDKAWSYYIKDNQMFIEAGQVPEPATYAALLGALALGFAAWRKRK